MRAGGARSLKRSTVPGPAGINSAGWLRNSTVPGFDTVGRIQQSLWGTIEHD